MLLQKYFIVLKRKQLNIVKKCARYSSTLKDFNEVPSPKGLPIIGTTLSLIISGSTPKLHWYVDKRHKELGSIYKENIGPVKAVFLSDPVDMRAVFAQEGKYPVHVLPEAWMVYNEMYGCSRGLFFMNGPEWLHNRRIMNKLLLKCDLQWIENSCKIATNSILERIHINDNQIFPDLESELYKWSIEVLVSILLGADKYKLAHNELQSHIKLLASTVCHVFHTSAKLALIPARFASKYKIPRWRRFVDSVDSALLAANNLVVYLLTNHPLGNGLLHKMQNECIPEIEIIRIVVDLVLAAGDTTAYSMEWMLYLISKNLHVQSHLREQLRTTEGLPVLLKNVMRESLRLYPVAPFLTRILPNEAAIAGYCIPAGTLIVMSVFSSGRNSKYYIDPNAFNPDRWLRSNAMDKQQQASLPFAIGARSCIGRRIAEMQLQIALGMIVKSFQIELLNDEQVDVILKMVAVPSRQIKLKFKSL